MEIRPCRSAELLTTELLIEILIRLPLVSVLLFRRVCKSWNHLILQPFFAELHRSFSPTPPTITLFCNFLTLERTTYGFITAEETSHFRYSLKYTGKVIQPRVPDLDIVGSCNGLFCLSSYDHDYYDKFYPDSSSDDCYRLFLWNPVLGSSLVQLPDPPQSLYDFVNSANLGFGYIPSTGQYKVVKLIYLEAQTSLVFHVCTIQRGGGGSKTEKKITASAWKSAFDSGSGQSGLPQLTGFFSNPTFFKGSILWIAETRGNRGCKSLIYFDIEKEEMQAFLLPPAVMKNKQLKYSGFRSDEIKIGVYYDDDNNDHLYLCDERHHFAYIWVMDNCKSVASLKLKWVIPLEIPDRMPLKLLKVHNTGKLLIGLKNSTLAYYDPTTGATERLMHFSRCELAIGIPNLLGCLL